MKICPYCKEEIKDDALKCRYCSSMLNKADSLQSAADDRQVTYILDRDLIRFVKVAGSILALFIVTGAFLYGFDLKKASDEIKAAREKTLTDIKELSALKADVIQLQKDVLRVAGEAKTAVAEIAQRKEEARGIVASMTQVSVTSFGEDRATRLVESMLVRHLTPILTAQQLAKLNESLGTGETRKKYTREDIARLVQGDLKRAMTYFRQHGFDRPVPAFEVAAGQDLANAYWDGTSVVFGMGLVNSDLFGPYEPGVVFHEVTHSLFELTWIGESGSVSEHVCDVIAVVIRGTGWTIGRVRSAVSGPPQALRSLEAPGTAFDNPTLGRDRQPSHMKEFMKDGRDSGAIHLNLGILNKAAYLMSEGGTHRGVTVNRRLGRETLGRLYSEVIKQLPEKKSVSFAGFRDLVIRVSEKALQDKEHVDIVRKSFQAVGL